MLKKIKELFKKKKTEQPLSVTAENLFKIRPTNCEEKEFLISVGEHLATTERFKSRKEAEEYIKEPKWDTVFAVMAELMEIHEKREKEQNNNADEDGSTEN